MKHTFVVKSSAGEIASDQDDVGTSMFPLTGRIIVPKAESMPWCIKLSTVSV